MFDMTLFLAMVCLGYDPVYLETNTNKNTLNLFLLLLVLLSKLGSLHSLALVELVENIGGNLLEHFLGELAQHAPSLVQRVEDGARFV